MISARSGPAAVSGQTGHAREADNEDQPAAAPGTHLGGPSHHRVPDPGPSVPCLHLKVLQAWILEVGDGFDWDGLTSSSPPPVPLSPPWR